MLGVLAFGDSITNGGGELQWGVALQSWALWTARALGLPYTPYATDGADVRDVLDEQIPAFERAPPSPRAATTSAASTSGPTTCAASTGTRSPTSATLREALAFLARALRAHADRDDPARPRPPARGSEGARTRTRSSSAARARPARSSSTSRGFRGRRVLMADHVHPTAFGQIAIAERALAVLERDGMTVRTRPRDAGQRRTSRRAGGACAATRPTSTATRRSAPGGGEPAQAAARASAASSVTWRRRANSRRAPTSSSRGARRSCSVRTTASP